MSYYPTERGPIDIGDLVMWDSLTGPLKGKVVTLPRTPAYYNRGVESVQIRITQHAHTYQRGELVWCHALRLTYRPRKRVDV